MPKFKKILIPTIVAMSEIGCGFLAWQYYPIISNKLFETQNNYGFSISFSSETKPMIITKSSINENKTNQQPTQTELNKSLSTTQKLKFTETNYSKTSFEKEIKSVWLEQEINNNLKPNNIPKSNTENPHQEINSKEENKNLNQQQNNDEISTNNNAKNKKEKPNSKTKENDKESTQQIETIVHINVGLQNIETTKNTPTTNSNSNNQDSESTESKIKSAQVAISYLTRTLAAAHDPTKITYWTDKLQTEEENLRDLQNIQHEMGTSW